MKKRLCILTLSILFICGCTLVNRLDTKEDLVNENVIRSSIINVENQEVSYDLYSREHREVIIIAPGFYNSKQTVLFKDMAEQLNDEYDVILFDFRGHGKSQGVFTFTAKEYQDMNRLIELAAKKYEKVGVIGFSLGAATSIITASNTNLIDSLIAVSPPSDFWKIDYQFWRLGFFENLTYSFFGDGRKGKSIRPGWPWHKKIKPIDVVHQIEAPVLFVHGQKNWLIRPWHSEKLFEKALGHKRLEIIRGGSHAEYLFRNDKDGTIKLFKDWFAQTLGSKSTTM